jgi:hypothetical protein
MQNFKQTIPEVVDFIIFAFGQGKESSLC